MGDTSPLLDEDGILIFYHMVQIFKGPYDFHLFPCLAPELRLQIWEHALRDPAVIQHTWNNDKFSYAFRRKAPAVLQVCKETRAWFIGGAGEIRYDLLRQREDDDGYIYINWMMDSVYIPRGYHFRPFNFEQLQCLRYLIMDWGIQPYWTLSSVERGVRFVQKLPMVEELTLVMRLFRPWRTNVQSDDRVTDEISALVLSKFEAETNGWTRRPPSLRVRAIRVEGRSRESPHLLCPETALLDFRA